MGLLPFPYRAARCVTMAGMTSLTDSFIEIAGAEGVLLNEPMSAHTTFRVGGPADWFIMPRSVGELRSVLELCDAEGVRPYVMGRGSNLLVADEGLRGAVVQIAQNMAGVEAFPDGTVKAQAGVSNAKVAAVAYRASLAGYEFAAGIPGTVGGAAIMNAGAYDGEFRDVAVEVTCLSPSYEVVKVPAEEADWSYRHSAMGDNGMIVLDATLKLHPGDPEEIQARMDDLAHRRSSKQPLDVPSAGSTFKRPPGHFAGKLIQDAGMQGHAVGGAMVSTKHAGFVVNANNATAADVLQVIRDVQAEVQSQFGVTLTPEVRMWGFDL